MGKRDEAPASRAALSTALELGRCSGDFQPVQLAVACANVDKSVSSFTWRIYLLERAHCDALVEISVSEHLRPDCCTCREAMVGIHLLVPQPVHGNGSGRTGPGLLIGHIDLKHIVLRPAPEPP